MEQLSGLDSLFLHTEMHGMPMHLSMLSIYDPSSSPSGRVDFRQILELFEKNIHDNVPLLRHKLMEVPFNLDQPYWVEDQNFDLVYHVRHIALPKPGNWQKLCSLTANLHAQPLNRGRPLWEAYIIDGIDHVENIPSGCFAILLKVHHALMDGSTGMAIFNSLHTLAATGGDYADTPPIDEARFFTHEPDVHLPTLLGKAAVNNVLRAGRLVSMLGSAVGLYSELQRAIKRRELHPLEKVKTRFNGAISPRRVVDRVRFDLDSVRFIKSYSEDLSLYDVVLSVISGALRLYLLAKSELPEDSLVAAVPLNAHDENEKGYSGNRINIANVSLRTDVANPLDRLTRIHKEALSGQAFARTLGKDILNKTLDNLFAALVAWGVRSAIESGVLEKFPPANNTIVTNIPGHPDQLFLCGAQMIDSFGLGPLLPNSALFHAVSKTHGHVTVSFTADRQKMEDPDFYVQCLERAFAELLDAVKHEKAVANPENQEKIKRLPKKSKSATTRKPRMR